MISNKDTVVILGGNGQNDGYQGEDLDINLIEIREPEVKDALKDFHIMSVCMVIITIAVCIIALKNLFSK